MLDCDWSPQISLDVNFSKLMDSNQILRIDFVCIHYHLWEMSCQIIECNNLCSLWFPWNELCNYGIFFSLASWVELWKTLKRLILHKQILSEVMCQNIYGDRNCFPFLIEETCPRCEIELLNAFQMHSAFYINKMYLTVNPN